VTAKAVPDDRRACQPGLMRLPLLCIGLAVCMVIGSALMHAAPAIASATRPLTVSLTFDDGIADQMAAQQLLKKHGMVGSFYINSSFIGEPGHMTRADLETLKANGHEIGGHSVSHLSLISLSAGEANRQICADRNTLLSWGYAVTSFAYPFSDFNASVKSTVQTCGYNTARAVGGLRSPHSCTECPTAEPLPPADLYATHTPDDINTTWTLQDLKNTVIRAETNGSWLALNFHHVCDACDERSIRASVLDQFLAWLQPRSGPTIGTTVKTVQQVVTGGVKPSVTPTPPPPPGDPGVNTVRNASLETVSSVNADLPTCFSSAGYGANSATYRRVKDAHSGSFGERVTVTSRKDGDAKLTPLMDLGECSSQVASGRTYEVSAWYKSNVQVFFTLFKRNAIGQWSFWTQSPRIAPASRWTRASWISPTSPADALAVSFGLTIGSVGTLTTDDYGFADTPALPPPAPPGVNALRNPSLETDGSGGFPQCWTGAGYGTNTVVWTRVIDAAEGRHAEKLDMTSRTDGDAKLIPIMDSANCSPTVTVGRPYVLGVSYKSTAPTYFTLQRQDAHGAWSYWTRSPPFAASDTYVAVTWQSPPVPAGTVAVSFGLTLDSVGSVTTDSYSLVAT
jgi:peptidoglycan/xylan/chitin deacetylase (PgdA/CDA1 family)